MDEQQKAFFGGQAGQPGESSGEDQETPPQSGGSSLTEERLRQVMAEEMERYARQQQSQRDQLEARVRKEVQQTIDLVKSSGVEVDEGKARTIQQAVANRIMQESQSGASPETPAQGQRQSSQGAQSFDTAFEVAQEWMSEAGTVIAETDPEAKMIDFNSTPAKFLSTVRKAIDAKAIRMQQASGNRSTVNTPGMSAGSGVGANLYNEYKKEVAANRGDMRAIIAIKQKYRKLGLKDI